MVGDPLPESWRWSTLGEVADPNSRAIVSGPFGSNIGSRFFVEQGVPVIRGNNLTTDMIRFIDDGFVFVSEEKADELGNCDAVVDDIVFTAAGSLGQVGIIPKNAKYPRYIISNKQLRARVDKRRIDPLFAFYWFSSKEMVEYVQQRNTGSSVPLINLSVLRALPLPLPPFSEQRTIAYILGTLDDKIELNRRMNETLEAMARASFKSWFVDFDPVRANSEGREPGLPKRIADLFPDSFEDSELGEIPAGWKVTRWGALVRLEYGKSLTGYAGENGVYPVYGTNGKIGSHSKPLCNHPGIIIGRKGAYRGVHYCSTPFYVIDTAFYVEPQIGTELRWAYYELLRQDINGMDSGSAIPSTSREDFYSLPVLSPPVGVQAAFAKYLDPFWSRQEKNISESRTLAALRDTLLPKLISGELRVRDAETFVEAAI